MALSAGTRLGSYEILGAIGAGGMGEVYRARDAKLNRDVALKVLPDSFANDPERLARFQREAQVLASLNHPNIAHIHGLEEGSLSGGSAVQDPPYVQAVIRALVMELVEGPTLADVIAGQAVGAGPRGIPIEEALPIATQIADALEAAHAQGIIHRDLKPANIKVRADGTVKVLDFGLAKAIDAGSTKQDPAYVPDLSQSPTITSPAMMTGAGIILGTAAYMSPEQAKGKAVDKRTDVWAFGCVLFEMLTGVRAFDGEDVSETMASILRAEPDWKLLPADVPEQMRFLIRRCLEKDRAKRIADFSVVQFLMNDALPTAAPPVAVARPASPMWQRLGTYSLTAILGGAIVAGMAYYVWPPHVAPIISRFSVTLADDEKFSNPGRHLVAISPDDTQIVYVANQRLWVRSMSDPISRAVPGTHIIQGVTNPVFSPDGRSLAFWSGADQTLKRIAVTGGAPVTICAASNPFGVSWGADGMLFGQGAGGIMRVVADGGKPEPLIRAKDGEIMHGPQMLPGGDVVLFSVATGSATDRWDEATIVAQSLTSGERTTLIENGSDARYLRTGHIVYALGGVMYAVAFDLGQRRITAGPVPMVEGIRRSPIQATGSMHFSVGSGGSLVFIPGPTAAANAADATLAVFDGKGSAERLKLPPGNYTSPRVSPDGKYVAFGNDDGNELSVWVYELSGASQMRRLTFGGNALSAVWSPDSQRLAFSSNRDGDGSIFLQRADGTDTAVRLTSAEKGAYQVPKSWSPDGKQLLFETFTGSGFTLWTYSFQDKKSTLIPERELSLPFDPVFSPDGQSIAYQSNETGLAQIYVRPFPISGVKYQVTKTGGSIATWSRDGRQIFYFPPNIRALAAVTITTQPSFTSGNPQTLQVGWPEIRGASRVYDVLPDGKGFIVVVPVLEQSTSPPTQQINVVLNWFEELKAKVPAGN